MPRGRKQPKYPGLNVPGTVSDAELRFFLEALKERVEMITGDRGDPEDRLVSVAELVDAGIAKSFVKQRRAEIIRLGEDGTTTTIVPTGGSDDAAQPPIIPPSAGVQSINGDFGDGFGAVDLELNDLSDVDTTGSVENDVIRKDNTDTWVNVPQTEIVDGGNF